MSSETNQDESISWTPMDPNKTYESEQNGKIIKGKGICGRFPPPSDCMIPDDIVESILKLYEAGTSDGPDYEHSNLIVGYKRDSYFGDEIRFWTTWDTVFDLREKINRSIRDLNASDRAKFTAHTRILHEREIATEDGG